MAVIGELSAVLVADVRQFTAKMGEAKAEMSGMSKSGSSSFNKLASVGKVAFFALGAAAIGIGVESVRLADTFDSSMAKVQAAAGLTAKQTSAVSNAFLATSGKTEESANSMAAAYAPVAAQLATVQKNALTASQAQQVMMASANLADAGMGSLTSTTSALAKTMQAYHLTAGQAAAASDILYKASVMTGTPVSAVASAFARLKMRLGDSVPPLKTVGGFMVDMAEHGIVGSRAVMMVSSSLTRLIAPSAATQKTLAELGITLTNAKGKFIGMSPALDLIRGALKKLPPVANAGAAALQKQSLQGELSTMRLNKSTPALKSQEQALQRQINALTLSGQSLSKMSALQALFGSSALTMAGLVNGGSKALNKATVAVSKHGSASWAAALQQKTLGGQMKVLEAMVNNYGARLGRVLIPKLEILASTTGKVVGWFGKNMWAAYTLAGVIGGALAIAVGAFAVNTLGKLITNAQKAYNSLKTLFGMKGAPSTTQPNLNTSATTAGDTLGAAIKSAGAQLIEDAQIAATTLETGGKLAGDAVEAGADTGRDALETGGDVSRDAMETGGDTARTSLETGGDVSRDAMETGGDTARSSLETGGDVSRDAMETGGDTARSSLETGGDVSRDAIETGGDTARSSLETGGDVSRDAIETGGDTARSSLETGGDVSRDAIETGGNIARSSLETGGDVSRDAMETGGDVAKISLETGGDASKLAMATGGGAGASALKLGALAFGLIIASQIAKAIDPKAYAKYEPKAADAFSKTMGTLGDFWHVLMNPLKASTYKTITGPSFLPNQSTTGADPWSRNTINFGKNAAQSITEPPGTTSTQATQIGSLAAKLSEANQTSKNIQSIIHAVEAKGAKSADLNKLVETMNKAVKPSDVAKTTAAVKPLTKSADTKSQTASRNAASTKTTAAVHAVAASTKTTTDAVHAVHAALQTGRPITVQNNQHFTITLNGREVATQIRSELLNMGRARGQNIVSAGPGRGAGIP